jgi:Ulp1 family protease
LNLPFSLPPYSQPIYRLAQETWEDTKKQDLHSHQTVYITNTFFFAKCSEETAERWHAASSHIHTDLFAPSVIFIIPVHIPLVTELI